MFALLIHPAILIALAVGVVAYVGPGRKALCAAGLSSRQTKQLTGTVYECLNECLAVSEA